MWTSSLSGLAKAGARARLQPLSPPRVSATDRTVPQAAFGWRSASARRCGGVQIRGDREGHDFSRAISATKECRLQPLRLWVAQRSSAAMGRSSDSGDREGHDFSRAISATKECRLQPLRLWVAQRFSAATKKEGLFLWRLQPPR
jgi:hypothetical protein